MRHLLLLSLGPVQDFIASARRCRDLWFGSHLLSELAKAGAAAILATQGDRAETLIFPAPGRPEELHPDSDLNVANKILARVDDPARAASEARAAMNKRLHEELRVASAPFDGSPFFDRSTAEHQVQDMLEFYWVSIPESGNWHQDRARAEALLAGRKSLRTFQSVTWGSDRPKSTLDGLRETVLDLSQVQTMPAEELRKKFGVRSGEYLCGVALLKRHGSRGAGAFSTSHLAALPFLDSLTEQDRAPLAQLAQELREVGLREEDLGNIRIAPPHQVFARWDGHFLFEERLADFVSDLSALEQARASLRRFLKRIGRRPRPYYAILLADGDRMGQALDGLRTAESHRAFSQRLATFASAARKLVQEHSGSAIYAGGDDVLALLPLHRALECGSRLAEDFCQRLKDVSGDSKPTLSVGIAVLHHLEPLSEGLALARRMERLAKQTRNALAVGVSKRSGSVTAVSGLWGEIDQRLEEWVRMHCENLVPRGAPYELRQLDLRLGSIEPGLLKLEAERVLRRKQPEGGQRARLEQHVLDSLLGKLKDTTFTVSQLARELIVAQTFAEARALAGREMISA